MHRQPISCHCVVWPRAPQDRLQAVPAHPTLYHARLLLLTTGVAAKSVDIVFLGSGPYQFAPLPFKYVRPAASADEATAAEADASSGTSNGALIGELGGGWVQCCC